MQGGIPPNTHEEIITQHVDLHLDKEKSCPICGLMFKQNKQDMFERHVQGHFETGILVSIKISKAQE